MTKKKNSTMKGTDIMYLPIIIALAIVVLIFGNYFIVYRNQNQNNQQIEHRLNNIKLQTQFLDELLRDVFQYVYLERDLLEKIMDDNFDANSVGDFSYGFVYNDMLDISEINQKNFENFNIIIKGNYKHINDKLKNELNKSTQFFEFMKIIYENRGSDFQAFFYSINNYILSYPKISAEKNILDSEETFSGIQSSFKELNKDINDKLIEDGWVTGVFYDETYMTQELSKCLPVLRNGKVYGILTNNIDINFINYYVKPVQTNEQVYIRDSYGDFIKKAGNMFEQVQDTNDLINEIYTLDIDKIAAEKGYIHIKDNYFFISQLDVIDWMLINTVPQKNIYNLKNLLNEIIIYNIVFIIVFLFVFKLLMIYKRKIRLLDKQKDEFTMMITHDLKTPLSSLVGFNELNRNKFVQKIVPLISKSNQEVEKTIAKMQRDFNIIEDEADRLTRMINNILDMYKLRLGKFQPNKQRVEGYDYINDCIEKLRPAAEKKGLQYNVEVDENIGFIYADRYLISQVFDNIIQNAIKYTNEGSITCRAYLEKKYARISIEDTGIGLEDIELQHIFNRFYRVENNQTNQVRGSGLGLAICKNIIELHNGSINVKGIKGQGSIFSFTIPTVGGDIND